MIKFDKFFEYLKENGISQYQLYTKYHVSRSLIQKLHCNESVTTYSLNNLLNILDCNIEDICEFAKDEDNNYHTQ